MIKPDHSILKEIEEQRPRFPPGLLSRQEKETLIERGILGLYRWYLARSQAKRNWNPDTSFNWGALRTDHCPELNRLIEGFFAIEQYAPDYASKPLQALRKSYGRSHFHIRWGSEEAKHSDLWLNTLLFLRYRTPKWIEDYKHALRSREYQLAWDDPLHMTLYTIFQERATQLSYLGTAAIARGKSDKPEFANDADPLLAEIAITIATDEVAHYSFFLEITRLFLYYFPTQTLEALWEVVKQFVMPALDLLPNGQEFFELVNRSGVYGPRAYAQDVLQIVFSQLGIEGRRALEEGIKRSRRVPDPDGNIRDTALFETLDYNAVQSAVRRLFDRIEQYEKEIGFSDIDPTRFVASGLAAN